MIVLTTFLTTDKGYRKILENKLYDSYIYKHIRYPVIDEEKWKLLLFLVEQHSSLTPVQREKYIISTMLVQIALDTHDFVPIKQKADTESEMVKKNSFRFFREITTADCIIYYLQKQEKSSLYRYWRTPFGK